LNVRIGTGNLPDKLEEQLRAYYGKGDESRGDTSQAPLTRDRCVTDAYHAVATFETCMLFLHAKLPKLSLSSLHNLCYFVDAVHFQQYGSCLFGTPARATTGVRYEIKLQGDLESILNGVAKYFHETPAHEITKLVEKEPGMAEKSAGGDILFSCMLTKALEASETVAQLMEHCPLKMGAASEQIMMSPTTCFAEQPAVFTDTVQRLQDAVTQVHQLQRELTRQLQAYDDMVPDQAAATPRIRASLPGPEVTLEMMRLTAGGAFTTDVPPLPSVLRSRLPRSRDRIGISMASGHHALAVSSFPPDATHELLLAVTLKVSHRIEAAAFSVFCASTDSSGTSITGTPDHKMAVTSTGAVRISDCRCGDAVWITAESGISKFRLHAHRKVQMLLIPQTVPFDQQVLLTAGHGLVAVSTGVSCGVFLAARVGHFETFTDTENDVLYIHPRTWKRDTTQHESEDPTI
jgi:hypothetical protein